jgi:hypothetical protein
VDRGLQTESKAAGEASADGDGDRDVDTRFPEDKYGGGNYAVSNSSKRSALRRGEDEEKARPRLDR